MKPSKRTLAPVRVDPPRVVSAVEQANCPVRGVLDRVGDKWSLLALLLLAEQPLRFAALRRSIEGVTQRMLTLTLRRLERDGLVLRRVSETVPPSVEYTLTPLGQSMTGAVEPLITWAQGHHEIIAENRNAYDRAMGDG
ncbi:MAG: helix-turn-helix domain-containing protein [Myxococcota bacterium]